MQDKEPKESRLWEVLIDGKRMLIMHNKKGGV
jgi:hypothetical protein